MYLKDLQETAVRVARRSTKKLGLNARKARPHELILFQKLLPSESDYRFSLKHEDAVKVLPEAFGLLDRDAFIATAFALGIATVPIINETEYSEAMEVAYWADPRLFPEPAGAGDLSEAQALRSVHWAKMSIQTNEGVRVDKAPVKKFETIQETQHSATTNNMVTGLELKSLGAAVVFGGGDENEIRISLTCRDKTLIGGPAARNNYLMIRLPGAIIKGSTTKQYLGA